VTGLLEVPPAGTLTGLAKRALPGVETFALKTPDDLDGARAFVARHGVSDNSMNASPTWRLVVAPFSGTVRLGVPGGDPVEPGAELAPGAKIGSVTSRRAEQTLIAEHGGTVLEWLVEDGDPVAPGQPLLRVHPKAEAH